MLNRTATLPHGGTTRGISAAEILDFRSDELYLEARIGFGQTLERSKILKKAAIEIAVALDAEIQHIENKLLPELERLQEQRSRLGAERPLKKGRHATC